MGEITTTQKFWTLVRYVSGFSNEEQMRYVRVNGKIPLWPTDRAARNYRDAKRMSKWDVLPHRLDIRRVTPKYVEMAKTVMAEVSNA